MLPAPQPFRLALPFPLSNRYLSSPPPPSGGVIDRDRYRRPAHRVEARNRIEDTPPRKRRWKPSIGGKYEKEGKKQVDTPKGNRKTKRWCSRNAERAVRRENKCGAGSQTANRKGRSAERREPAGAAAAVGVTGKSAYSLHKRAVVLYCYCSFFAAVFGREHFCAFSPHDGLL